MSTPNLQMRKLRLRKMKSSQGHLGSKEQTQASSPRVPETCFSSKFHTTASLLERVQGSLDLG